ncbi:MAG TPA: hypothetical protein VGP70_09635 [Actinomadura sp.]|nr:hypothetical protein [Actinomadura sp.]
MISEIRKVLSSGVNASRTRTTRDSTDSPGAPVITAVCVDIL